MAATAESMRGNHQTAQPDQSQGTAVNLDVLREALSSEVVAELERAYQRKCDLADSYAAACESQAQKAGIHASVLKAWIKARVEDKEREHKTKAEQLQLLFDELPQDEDAED